MKRPGSLVLVVAGVGAAAAAVLARFGLSRTSSKYLDQTERDIDAAFDDAETQDVILEVDEADELFDRGTTADDQDPD
jgi:long-subunit fatty acid transport protein